MGIGAKFGEKPLGVFGFFTAIIPISQLFFHRLSAVVTQKRVRTGNVVQRRVHSAVVENVYTG